MGLLPHYDLIDVDLAWQTILSGVGPLSDGSPVPVFIDANSPQRAKEACPAIAVKTVAMLPDWDRYEGIEWVAAGRTYDANGNPVAEVERRPRDHYVMQYQITTYAGTNYEHDKELMIMVGRVLTPRPLLPLDHLMEGSFLEGVQLHVPEMSSRIVFQNDDKIVADQKTLEKSWFYMVHVSLSHPEVRTTPVARSTSWSSGQSADSPSGGVTLTMELGPADPAAVNEMDLPVDKDPDSGTIPLKVRIDET